jgi:hypothetical protein
MRAKVRELELKDRKMRWKICTKIIFAMAMLNGCASSGPGTVARDRFDYISAISEPWKSQMLLNLVKLRFDDAPCFSMWRR